MADMEMFRMNSEGAGWVSFSQATEEEILSIELGLLSEFANRKENN